MEVMESKANDDVAWKMGRIMLRYRPIAPKPLAAGAAPAASLEPSQSKKRAGARRKSTVSGGGQRGRKSRKLEAASGGTAPVVTLPLMPMTPERKEGSIAKPSTFFFPVVVPPRPVRAVPVSVTVESVTEAWGVKLRGSANQDEELKRWLEAGDCPAFVSRAADQVAWTNAACRRMVVGGAESPSSSSSSYSSSSWSDAVLAQEAAGEEEVRVVLVTRGLVPGDACRAFTCMTSVRYACGRRGKVSLAAPCDVWRLDDGSLAWRLDVKAALSLSTGN